MSSLRNRTESALRTLAEGKAPPDFLFAFEREQTVGEPISWRETIAYERGRQQSLRRWRSTVDAGGDPIGMWTTPAEEARTVALARALCELRFFERENTAEITPGQDVIRWSCITPGALFEFVVDSGSPLVAELAPLELELRRLANDIESTRRGAALGCALQIERKQGIAEAAVTLVNHGDRACVIFNPLVGVAGERDYLRVEMADLSAEPTDVSGPGLSFMSVPIPPLERDLEVPFGDPYIVLLPGSAVRVPLSIKLAFPSKGPWLVRAVYSAFGSPEQVAGVPLLNGRVFSNEVSVQV